VSFVQPYIPQDEKWDSSRSIQVLRTIEKVTLATSRAGKPDFIVWPESVVPYALYRDPNVAPWLESVAQVTNKPILLGTVYTRMSGGVESWYNGATLVDPVTGVSPEVYAKRKLVPFGEYIPLRPVLGWLDKIVPIAGDFFPGSDSKPFSVPVGDGHLLVGVLICYEDIFPSLARESVQSGAEVLAVLTNNAWYGEGGAAYQHATHSVLRAVETRRPVIRCGHGGWSGWIDEFGNIRATLNSESGSVYFRGGQTLTVTRDLRWRDRQSFYTQHGDWFLLVCAVLAVAAYYLVIALPPVRPAAPGEGPF
jgi:apolipoprotein N-acyltransferase